MVQCNQTNKMNQYKVTLNFSFEKHYPEEFEGEEDYDEVVKAFARTDKYYRKHDIVQYIKENDALAFVECVLCDGEIVSAEWLPNKFAIQMVVDTDQDEEDLEEDLRATSLEDSEYEACGETGWIVMTRDKDGNPFGPPWDMKGFWEYGLTDYRRNPIKIQKVGVTEEIPESKELFTVTEKGKEIHAKMAKMKMSGFRFNKEDEQKFKMLRVLLNDPRHYPV